MSPTRTPQKYPRHLLARPGLQHATLRNILDIDWQDQVSNYNVLTQKRTASKFAMLHQGWLRGFRHVTRLMAAEYHCMDNLLLAPELRGTISLSLLQEHPGKEWEGLWDQPNIPCHRMGRLQGNINPTSWHRIARLQGNINPTSWHRIARLLRSTQHPVTE